MYTKIEVIAGVILAYIISGAYTVITDIGADRLHRPSWALRPTFSKAVLVGLTWFTRPFIDQYYLHSQKARATAFGLFNLIIEFTVLVAILVGIIHLSFGYLSVPVALSVIFVVGILGAFYLPTIVVFIALPITFLGSLPLNIIFPLKRKND